jgi:hypothetical protein
MLGDEAHPIRGSRFRIISGHRCSVVSYFLCGHADYGGAVMRGGVGVGRGAGGHDQCAVRAQAVAQRYDNRPVPADDVTDATERGVQEQDRPVIHSQSRKIMI